MSAETDHPVFEPPYNRNIKIWRYMDFTKYVSMLSNTALFFSRTDLFEDPYEGATSHANIKLRDEVYRGKEIPEKGFEQMSKFAEWIRQWTYINCWHMNEYESAAMWKLYSKTDEAIAIQSTYQTLYECLSSGTYLGVVKYIDYEKDWMPEGNTFWPFVHKRKSFEHERELRAVKQELPNKEKGISVGKPNEINGKSINIDFEKLVKKVFISPDAPLWFYNLVNKVTDKFGKDVEIKQSKLGKEPIF